MKNVEPNAAHHRSDGGSPVDQIVVEWLNYLRIEKGSSPHTLSNYRRDVAKYAAFLRGRGIRDLGKVTHNDIEDFLMDLRSGDRPAAPSSVARYASALRSLHRFATREGMTASDVSTNLTVPKLGQRLPKALSIDEISALLGAAHSSDDAISLRDAALLEVLYATGARVSEAVNLALDDLDLDAELPVLRLFGKGRKERLVPVGSYACEALDAYLVRSRPILAARGHGVPHVFLNKRGNPLSRQSAWEIINDYAQATGIADHVSPHTLRHSFATHLLEGGASVRDVQELLGHASVHTTQIYTQMTAATLREVHRMTHPRAR